MSRSGLTAGLILEGLLLALFAGGAAAVLSMWVVRFATEIIPAGVLPRGSAVAVDGRILLVSTISAALCGIAFGSVPGWVVARANLVDVIKGSGGPVIGGRMVNRTLGTLLVVEIGAVCALLVATVVSVSAFIKVTTVDLGFEHSKLVSINYERLSQDPRAFSSADAATLRDEILSRAKVVRGVLGAAVVTNGGTPLSGSSVRYSLNIPGIGETGDNDLLETRFVSVEYFQVMGMKLISGRLFDARDRAGAPSVILINDAAARRFFQGRDPVGQVVDFRGAATIVGVLKGVHFKGPELDVKPEMYLPADQDQTNVPKNFGVLVLRADGNVETIGKAVREAIRPVLGSEPEQPQFADEMFRRLTVGRRFNAIAMTLFGVVGVALGLTGIYGTVRFLINRQIRELGLRMALGASRSSIMRAVLGLALRRILLGTLIGLLAAWSLSSVFQALAFGVDPNDTSVYLGVATILCLIGLIASLPTALRAAYLDPAETLRRD